MLSLRLDVRTLAVGVPSDTGGDVDGGSVGLAGSFSYFGVLAVLGYSALSFRLFRSLGVVLL